MRLHLHMFMGTFKAYDIYYSTSFHRDHQLRICNHSRFKTISLSTKIMSISHIPIHKWSNYPRWSKRTYSINSCNGICIAYVRSLIRKPVNKFFFGWKSNNSLCVKNLGITVRNQSQPNLEHLFSGLWFVTLFFRLNCTVHRLWTKSW